MSNIDSADQAHQLTPPYVKVYGSGGPNVEKFQILTKLLNAKFEQRKLSIPDKEHKEPWYLKINPTGRIPSLSDVDKDGNQKLIIESNNILLYLADKYDVDRKYSFSQGSLEYYQVLEWLLFQVGTFAPTNKYANLFKRDGNVEESNKFRSEVLNILKVLNDRVAGNNGFLVSDHFTIADFSFYPFIARKGGLGITFDDYPALGKWFEALKAIPEVSETVVV